MSRRFGSVTAASLVACAAVAGPLASAQASDSSIRAAVKRGVPAITKSQGKVLDGLATYEKTHSATALLKAIKTQDRALNALRTSVSGDTASSATGKTAQGDIVTGLKLIAGSNETLAKELKKSAHGEPVSKAKLKASVVADKKGNIDVNRGLKLLKV